jgi:hypothetical protein
MKAGEKTVHMSFQRHFSFSTNNFSIIPPLHDLLPKMIYSKISKEMSSLILSFMVFCLFKARALQIGDATFHPEILVRLVYASNSGTIASNWQK